MWEIVEAQCRHLTVEEMNEAIEQLAEERRTGKIKFVSVNEVISRIIRLRQEAKDPGPWEGEECQACNGMGSFGYSYVNEREGVCTIIHNEHEYKRKTGFSPSYAGRFCGCKKGEKYVDMLIEKKHRQQYKENTHKILSILYPQVEEDELEKDFFG